MKAIQLLKSKKFTPWLSAIFFLGIIGSLFLKVFYFQFTSGISKLPFFTQMNARTFIAILGCVLILVAVATCTSFKKTFLILFILDILISITMLADTLYARYYSNPLTMNVIIYQFQFLGAVQGSTNSLFKLKDLIFILDFPIFIFLLYILPKKDSMKWYYKFGLGIIFFVAGLSLVNFTYKRSDTSQYTWERKYMARDLGALYYHYDDVKRFVKKQMTRNMVLTDDEISGIRREVYKQNSNQYSGIAEGKNLLMIQLEAFQGFVINKTIEGQEITPNLNKLIKESIYAENLYNQVGFGNTVDAEFLSNNSLYPSRNGAVYYLYPENIYHSVANALGKKDYYTGAFHGYEPSFWNRTDMYRSLGFNRFYSLNDFEMDEKVGWAVGDKSFFRQSIDYLIEDAGEDKFYGFLVSLSSHHPFDAFVGFDFNVGKYEGTMLGNFIRGANYVDEAIEEMLTYLKEKGLYEDTIIVIYGDHSAMFGDQAENLSEFMDVTHNPASWESLQKVPLIIHVPGMNEEILIKETAGQIDILPTVANLMNLELDFMMGRDLLNFETGYAIRTGGKVITDQYIYLGERNVFYDVNSFEQLVVEEAITQYQEEVDRYMLKHNISNVILDKDAMRKLDQ